jgi:hypothetical protein
MSSCATRWAATLPADFRLPRRSSEPTKNSKQCRPKTQGAHSHLSLPFESQYFSETICESKLQPKETFDKKSSRVFIRHLASNKPSKPFIQSFTTLAVRS